MKSIASRILDAIFPPPRQEAPKVVPPEINTKKCTGCGLCVTDCAAFELEMRDGKAANSGGGYGCVECGHCVAVCPAGAIKDTFAEKGDNRAFGPGNLPSAAALQTLFRSKRSVRIYRDKPVPRELLEKIIEAGRYAPIGGNRPDVHFMVLSSAEEVSRLRGPALAGVMKMFTMLDNKALDLLSALPEGGAETMATIKYYKPILDNFEKRWKELGDDRLFYNAPAIILVHGKRWDETISWSCAIALHQASLMAQIHNVGSCYNGLVQVSINRDAKIREMLGIPNTHKCYGAMTLGYQKLKYRKVVRRRPAQVTWR